MLRWFAFGAVLGTGQAQLTVACSTLAGVDWAREKGKTDKELVEEMRRALSYRRQGVLRAGSRFGLGRQILRCPDLRQGGQRESCLLFGQGEGSPHVRGLFAIHSADARSVLQEAV